MRLDLPQVVGSRFHFLSSFRICNPAPFFSKFVEHNITNPKLPTFCVNPKLPTHPHIPTNFYSATLPESLYPPQNAHFTSLSVTSLSGLTSNRPTNRPKRPNSPKSGPRDQSPKKERKGAKKGVSRKEVLLLDIGQLEEVERRKQVELNVIMWELKEKREEFAALKWEDEIQSQLAPTTHVMNSKRLQSMMYGVGLENDPKRGGSLSLFFLSSSFLFLLPFLLSLFFFLSHLLLRSEDLPNDLLRKEFFARMSSVLSR